jgi:hypothetical protein
MTPAAIASPAAALVPLALAALLVAAGWAAARAAAAVGGARVAVAGMAGALVLHLALSLAVAIGSPWSRGWVVAPLLAAAAAGAALQRRRPAVPSAASAAAAPAGWGDAIAALAVLAFAALSWTRWIAISDYVFHWGLKGHRFYLARGIDYEYLARPWNWVVHPDYPNLLPEVYTSTALLLGRWSEPPTLLWSAVVLAASLAVARDVFAGARLPPLSRQVALATLALLLAAFGTAHVMAGAADWLVALALMAALPALLRPPDAGGDLHVALCAAFAASSKLEGITLAAWLLLVQLLRRRPWRWRTAVPAALRLGLPVLAVAAPWAAGILQHSLFQPFNTGAPALSRAAVAAPALLQAIVTPAWYGAPLALVLLPALLRRRGTHAAAAVVALQLLTYLWQYVTAPLDTGFLVLSTFARLLLHLLPATLVLAAVAWLAEPAADGDA